MQKSHVAFLQTQDDISYQTVHQEWDVLEIRYANKALKLRKISNLKKEKQILSVSSDTV